VPESDYLALLKAAYAAARDENERLRDARRGVTRQLGPLPISASVVAGLVAGFNTESIQCESLLWLALVLLVTVLIPLSILYSNMRPYRALREDKEELLEKQRVFKKDERPSEIAEALTTGPPANPTKELIQWYESMLSLERSIYGGGERKHWYCWRTPRLRTPIDSLVEGFERERSGLVVVQFVFAVVILLLVLSRLSWPPW
jgi:hypothetical protein